MLEASETPAEEPAPVVAESAVEPFAEPPKPSVAEPIGAAVAGAFWLYGLVDGIRSAKRYRPEQPPSEAEDGQSASLELFPRGGAVYRATGDLDFTLLRVRL